MSFAQPLWLLLLPLAVLLWQRRWRMDHAAFTLPQAQDLPECRRGIVWGDAILRSLIVTLLIIAAAGPRTPDLKTRLPSQGVSIALVVDVSGSMATPDYGNTTRLAAAKAAFDAFIDRRPDDAIAVVAFAAVPRTECPPTLNHSVAKSIVNALEPRSGLDAGTNIGDAIAEALIRLRSTTTRRAIVLLTDGEHNASGSGADAPLTPRQAAQLAANLGVPLYAIDCGGTPSDPDAKAARAAGREVLAQVASLTGGAAFTADDPAELDRVMTEISALERAPIESFQYRRYHTYGHGFALAAAGLWLVLIVLERTVWRVWP